MSKSFSYANIQLKLAINDLAIGEGDIRSRLSDIYGNYFYKLNENDFPQELKNEWLNIIDSMSKLGSRVLYGKQIHTPVENTMMRIKNKTGSRIAERIIGLKRSLVEHS